MKLLLILPSAITLAIACQSPPLWQAKVIEFDPSQAFARRAELFYDEDDSIALFDDVTYQGRETYTFDLFLYDKAKYYSVNLQTQACTIGSLSGSFPVIKVPPGSNLTGQYYIGVTGVPNDYVLVNHYEDFNGNYLGSWTANLLCAPVAAFVNTTKYGNIFFNFFDFGPLQDPNIFNVPKQCS